MLGDTLKRVFRLAVCVSISTAALAAGADEGLQIYERTCQVCHAAGVNGAPRPHVPADWEYRLDYGVEDLYLNVIEGLGAKMPPRGACAQCSDAQLQAAVDYMLAEYEKAKGDGRQ